MAEVWAAIAANVVLGFVLPVAGAFVLWIAIAVSAMRLHDAAQRGGHRAAAAITNPTAWLVIGFIVASATMR